jgi:hypothetical protein
VESALAFYDKVVDIWYKFLASVRGDAQVADGFGEAQLSEVHNSIQTAHIIECKHQCCVNDAQQQQRLVVLQQCS